MKQAAASEATHEADSASPENHSLAELFPPMSPAEIETLSDDIKRNGLIDPIVLYEDKVLDGVNRLKACREQGIEPRFETWKGEAGTPLQFVCAKNWSRRSLTPSQRAVIALTFEQEFAAEAKVGRPKKAENGDNNTTVSGKSRDKAAEVVGASPSYITKAKRLRGFDLNFLEEVRCGTLTLPVTTTEAKVKKPQSTSVAEELTHKARIVIRGQVLASDWMSKKDAHALADDLAAREVSVRLMTNLDTGYERVSKTAPKPSERHAQFKALDCPRKIVTIEPVSAPCGSFECLPGVPV